MAVAYFDESEIRKAISILKPEGELFEIRIISGNKKQKPYVGYFKSADVLIGELRKQNLKGCNVYITLQKVKDACYSREQKDVFVQGASTTSDNDIEGYEWLMIDLDPDRPSGVSSTKEELQKAKDLGNKIYTFLSDMGFEKPFTGFSGNGVHLLYKVMIANTKDREALIKNCLNALNLLFGTPEIKVDCANFNPSRICKLYGTLAQKGSDTEDRPHRMSSVLSKATEYKPTDLQYLEKLSDVIPKEPEKPQAYNNYRPSEFDLEDWLYKYGLHYTKVSYGDGDKYVLDECPFDSSHKAPDACVFKMRNGALGFHCFHHSCQCNDWRELRMKYEPDAYEKKRQYEERKAYHSFNRDPEPPKKIEQKEDPVFITPEYMLNSIEQTHVFIRTGIYDYDKAYRGLEKQRVTIISGYSGGSKSTLMSQIMLNAMDNGNRVFCFSGELYKNDVYDWLTLQAAGKSNTEMIEAGRYKVKPEVRKKILKWLQGKFWLYNNKYGYNFEAILNFLKDQIDTLKLDLLCIDNLMAMDIRDLAPNKYDAQAAFMWNLHELSQEKNVHIIVVCHPKKPSGLLSLYDVSGASEIVNAVDNIIYVYRNTQQFRNAYVEFFKHEWNEPYTNIWHCAKARYGSVTDDYIGLYYEPETKRLKSTLTDNRIYGWDNEFKDSIPEEIPF